MQLTEVITSGPVDVNTESRMIEAIGGVTLEQHDTAMTTTLGRPSVTLQSTMKSHEANSIARGNTVGS